MGWLPVRKGARRWLDFDIENRPSTYWLPDRPTAEITAIAWAFTDKPNDVHVRLLGRDEPEDILLDFVAAYNEADGVTGHYIRKHDLPIINAHLMLYGLPTLGPKLSQDTKLDMVRKADLSASQEDLAAMLGVSAPKVQMSQREWRLANQLTEEGLALTEKRVVGDVKQHMKLRKAMLAAGLLKPARIWRP